MRTINLMSAALLAAAMLAPVPGVAGTTASSFIQLAQNRPSASCDRDRKACYSASAQTGTYGARYVPPDAARMCEEAYRACIGRR